MTKTDQCTGDLRGLALTLRQLEVAKWTAVELRRVADDQGWEWSEGTGVPRLRTGSPFGEAWLSVVDSALEGYVTTEEFVGLHFVIAEKGTRAQEEIQAFREAHEELRDVLGPSYLLGADDTDVSFHWDAPDWGAPYVRWRDPAGPNLIELRATVHGTVLTLRPKEPAEGWYCKTVEHSDGRVGGFVISVLASENVGLQLPGVTLHPEWRDYGAHLAKALRTRAAEVTALGLTQSQGLYTAIPGTGTGLAFSLSFGEQVEVGITTILEEDADLEAMDLPSMGWVRAPEERRYEDDIVHLAPVQQYDEVNGVRLALMLLEVAEQAGLDSPEGLLAAEDLAWLPWVDHSFGPGRIKDYGFALRVTQ